MSAGDFTQNLQNRQNAGQASFYNSRIGRFVQPDTIIPGAGNPQAFNRYAYVLNNPVNFVDPSGHEPGCTKILDEQCLIYKDSSGASVRRDLSTSVAKPELDIWLDEAMGEFDVDANIKRNLNDIVPTNVGISNSITGCVPTVFIVVSACLSAFSEIGINYPTGTIYWTGSVTSISSKVGTPELSLSFAQGPIYTFNMIDMDQILGPSQTSFADIGVESIAGFGLSGEYTQFLDRERKPLTSTRSEGSTNRVWSFSPKAYFTLDGLGLLGFNGHAGGAISETNFLFGWP